MREILLGFFALAILSACGGGSTSNPPPLTGINALRAETSRLATIGETLDVTPADSVAVTGRAEFQGVLAVGLLPDSYGGIGLGGDMTMGVDFDTGDVTGEVVDFYSRDGEALDGALALSNGAAFAFADGVFVGAEVSGDLEIYGEVKDVEGIIAGGVAGDGGEIVAGLVELDYDWQLPGDGPIITTTLEGGFIVERQ